MTPGGEQWWSRRIPEGLHKQLHARGAQTAVETLVRNWSSQVWEEPKNVKI